MWWFLIGMFLRNAAQSSYQSLRIRSTLGGEPVSRFMNPAPVAVPSNLSLQDLVDEFIFRHNHKVFPVVAPNHALAGRVGVDQVKSVPRDEWARHTVSEVMERRSPTNTIGPNADAAGTLEKMTQSGITRMMVADGDRLVGVIALRDLLHRLLLKLEMEDAGMPDMFHPAHH
jgi:CBS domain-containing protein